MVTWGLDDGATKTQWKVSSDGGLTWQPGGTLRRLEPASLNVGVPDICVSGEGQFIAATRFADIGYSIALYEGRAEGEDIQWTGPSFPIESFRSPLFTRKYLLPSVAFDVRNNRLYVAAVRSEYGAGDAYQYDDVWFFHRTDGVWSEPRILSGDSVQGSKIVVDEDGNVLVFWHDLATRQIICRRSTDLGVSFGEPIVVSPVEANFTYPPNYHPSYNYASNLYCISLSLTLPSVAVDTSNGPHRGSLYAVWSESMIGELEPVIGSVAEQEPNDSFETATQVDYGLEFTGASRYIEGVGTDADLFCFNGRAGETVYLTGTIGSPFCTTYLYLSAHNYSIWGTSSFAVPGQRSTFPLIATLPADGKYYTSFAVSSRGPALAYRYRLQRMNPTPESVARDHRDIVFTSSSDGGLTWTPKKRLNDDPPRFDNAIPEVAVDGLGRVHVTWYDRRDDPNGLSYHVYWAHSSDGGRTFEPSQRLSASQGVVDPLEKTRLGVRMGLAGTEEGIVAAWTYITNRWERGRNEHDILARRADLPTEAAVRDLAAAASIGNVRLSWRVQEPEVLWKFEVYRRSPGGEFASLGTVARASDPGRDRYEFMDETAHSGADYEYRVDMILANGRARESDVVRTAVPVAPQRLEVRLLSSGSTTDPVRMEIDSPVSGTVVVDVFNVRGARLRTVSAGVAVGKNVLEWDGRDESGRPVPSGVYYIEAGISSHRSVVRLTRT